MTGPSANAPPAPPPSSAPADWKRMRLWQIQPIRDGMIIAGVVGLLYLGYQLSIVTVPLLIALALAYLFEPLIAKVTRKGWLSRPGAAIGVIIIAGTVIIVPLVLGLGFAFSQGVQFGKQFTNNLNRFVASVDNPDDKPRRDQLHGTWLDLRDYVVEQNKVYAESQPRTPPEPDDASRSVKPNGDAPPAVPANEPPTTQPPTSPSDAVNPARAEPASSHKEGPIHRFLNDSQFSAAQLIQPIYEWLRTNSAKLGTQALAAGGGVVSSVAKGVTSVWVLLFGAFLTAFFFFFLSTGYGKVVEFWRSLIPERRKSRVLDLLDQMDRVISGFIRGRITISFCMMIIYSIGYLIIGVPAWLILGPLVGLATLVPYLSGIVGIPGAIIVMVLEPSTGVQGRWWWIVFAPVVVFAVAQFTDDYILSPRIQGKTTNMDMPTILFASLAGGVLAGVYGLLLAIPVAACVRILLREVFWPRFRQWAQGRARDFLPIEPDV